MRGIRVKRLLIALCVLFIGFSVNAQTKKPKKAVKKTVITEEIDSNGKTIKKTETTIAEDGDGAEDEDTSDYPPVTPVPEGLKTINENWYTLWGLGFSGTSYSGELGDAYKADENLAGADRGPTVNIDLLGFYWPLQNHKTMLGFILNGAGDIIEIGTYEESLYTYLLGFSAHHFFGANIGDGWFLRGDAGLAWSRIDIDSGSLHADKSSKSKLGIMIGGGYGFALGRETRLLLGLYFRPLPKMDINGYTLKGTVTNFTVGFLF
jgi:hypothetical protein